MNKRKFIIWTGAILLFVMLATCYLAVDRLYNPSNVQTMMPQSPASAQLP